MHVSLRKNGATRNSVCIEYPSSSSSSSCTRDPSRARTRETDRCLSLFDLFSNFIKVGTSFFRFSSFVSSCKRNTYARLQTRYETCFGVDQRSNEHLFFFIHDDSRSFLSFFDHPIRYNRSRVTVKPPLRTCERSIEIKIEMDESRRVRYRGSKFLFLLGHSTIGSHANSTTHSVNLRES